jgi:BirA family biotin operon repressor/biotin-[acetyl-CoA-carboxylase] ligase
MTPWFDAEEYELTLRQRGARWGRPLVALDSAPSTNDLALEAEKAGAPEGATFIVRAQTSGRGRRGNAWWAPAGDNLTCSLLVRPEQTAAVVSSLPLVVGLAVREVIARILERGPASRFGLTPPVAVKWPNDVWVGSRKIAGVLVESRLRGALVGAAVIGVGLNVHTRTFPEELAGKCTSLGREGAQPPTLPVLLAELVANLETRYERFLADGLASFLPELEACDALRGQRVRIDELEGTAAGIDAQGALRVLDGRGAVQTVHAGHVEVLGA